MNLPWTYQISRKKCILLRHLKDFFSREELAREKSTECLPVLVYRHSSLIRRRLGNTEMQLQENKAVNLSLAAPRVNGILIRPGETFSFWELVGPDDKRHGYKKGLTISKGQASQDMGRTVSVYQPDSLDGAAFRIKDCGTSSS